MAVAKQVPSPLRECRVASGMTQGELAARASVSRQLVAAAEAGQNTPAVDAALRLAGALGTSVETLFTPAAPPVAPALGGSLPGQVPLRVGRVGEQLVAAELADHGVSGAGWASPDAVIESGRLRLFGGAAPAGLVLAGCDPAIGVVEAMLEGLGARSALAVSAATGTALRSLARGRLHAAVVHGPPGRLPAAPVSVIRLHLARWRVGVALSKRRHDSLEGLLQGELPLAQRDPAASSQQALQRAAHAAGVASLPAGPRATGHLDGARIAALRDCAAVTTEAAARAFGLRFLALEEHAVEIWIAECWQTHPGVEALGGLLTSAGFTERIAQFGGYELTGCGRRIEGSGEG